MWIITLDDNKKLKLKMVWISLLLSTCNEERIKNNKKKKKRFIYIYV